MESLGIGYWIVLIVGLFILLWPVSRIANRAGYSGWWAVLLLVPVVNLIMVWVFAFAEWPKRNP